MNRPLRRFLHRLCLELGYPHPRHLLDQLTARELREWIEYFSQESKPKNYQETDNPDEQFKILRQILG